MPYAEVFEAFPEELRVAVARLVDALKAEFDVKRTDFAALQSAVQELAAAQARTETRLEELAAAQARTETRLDRVVVAVEELAQAQKRTETRLEELAAAQARTDARLDRLTAAVEELAQAQKRTETRLEELAAAQARTDARLEELAAAQARTETRLEELAAAQARTETRLDQITQEQTLFRRTFVSQIGGLGARWGLQTEGAFRNGIRTILEDIGFTTERFLTWDATGEVFGHPEQVELDVVVQNGQVIIVEIKSALDRANAYLLHRKVAFYTKHTGRQVDRQVVVAPYADESARDVAQRLGIEVCTDINEFH